MPAIAHGPQILHTSKIATANGYRVATDTLNSYAQQFDPAADVGQLNACAGRITHGDAPQGQTTR